MDRKDRVFVAGLIIILIFMVINIFSTVHTMNDYEERKESGNDRWKQVENRILDIEQKVNEIEEEIK